MYKKVLNIVTTVFCLFVIFSFLSFNISMATGGTSKWINPSDYEPGTLNNADKVKNIGNDIIGIFQMVGSFVSVIVVIILGIKYMIGSVEEKAEYKKTMWPYIVGAILVFAITNILAIVQSISSQIGK